MSRQYTPLTGRKVAVKNSLQCYLLLHFDNYIAASPVYSGFRFVATAASPADPTEEGIGESGSKRGM